MEKAQSRDSKNQALTKETEQKKRNMPKHMAESDKSTREGKADE